MSYPTLGGHGRGTDKPIVRVNNGCLLTKEVLSKDRSGGGDDEDEAEETGHDFSVKRQKSPRIKSSGYGGGMC